MVEDKIGENETDKTGDGKKSAKLDERSCLFVGSRGANIFPTGRIL